MTTSTTMWTCTSKERWRRSWFTPTSRWSVRTFTDPHAVASKWPDRFEKGATSFVFVFPFRIPHPSGKLKRFDFKAGLWFLTRGLAEPGPDCNIKNNSRNFILDTRPSPPVHSSFIPYCCIVVFGIPDPQNPVRSCDILVISRKLCCPKL